MNTKMNLLCGLFLGILSPHANLSATLCSDLINNSLIRVDQIIFLPSVKTISWLEGEACINTYGAYAFLGGQPYQDVDFKIYKLTAAETLTHVADGSHGAYVLASDWCCINGIPYVAVAGAANAEGYEVEIYRFNPLTNALTRVAYYTHGANVNALSWLCDCSSTGSSYLAIGGEASSVDMADVRVLFVPTFTNEAIALQATASKIHGAPVYSVDWCPAYTVPLLAIGGRTSSLECGINIRVYSVDCATGYLYPFAQQTFSGGLVNSVKWCCNLSACAVNPVLAAGGSTGTSTDSANIRLYCLSSLSHNLTEYAQGSNIYQPTITALDWNPSCRCAFITVGGACGAILPDCTPNLFVYKKDGYAGGSLEMIIEEQFKHTITALAWYHPSSSSYSYLLVGGESNYGDLEGITFNPECRAEPMVILYRAAYCNAPKFEGIPPICLRTPLRN